MSDLHVEFGALDKPLPTGDVLILAGDITLLGAFDRTCDLYYLHEHIRSRTEALLNEARAKFSRIVYLIGNHEAYHYDIAKAPAFVRKWEGVTLLQDNVIDLGDDVLLVGGTLWTDMNGGRDAGHIARNMNDFRLVEHNGPRFTPWNAMVMFAKTRQFISDTAVTNPDKTIVVATHHAPSIQGIAPEHLNDMYGMNHGYYTDLESFIEAHPNIRFWVHGHTHVQKAYKIGQCQVVANCRGYVRRESCARTFDPDCWFDPVSGLQKLPATAVDEAAE
jgi:hypothetical protein